MTNGLWKAKFYVSFPVRFLPFFLEDCLSTFLRRSFIRDFLEVLSEFLLFFDPFGIGARGILVGKSICSSVAESGRISVADVRLFLGLFPAKNVYVQLLIVLYKNCCYFFGPFITIAAWWRKGDFSRPMAGRLSCVAIIVLRGWTRPTDTCRYHIPDSFGAGLVIM